MGKNEPELKSEKNEFGRTWADLISDIPIWLIASSLTIFIGIVSYASFIAKERISLGFLGDFGPGTDAAPKIFPAGAVIAFDRDYKSEAACPEGWSYFEPSGGRFVVGAGEHDNKWFSLLDGSERQIPTYQSYSQEKYTGNAETIESKATGGEVAHTLTLAEMPSHSHVSGPFKYLVRRGDLTAISGDGGESQKEQMNISQTAEVPAIGGNGEHNNMPPFIALTYCKYSVPE